MLLPANASDPAAMVAQALTLFKSLGVSPPPAGTAAQPGGVGVGVGGSKPAQVQAASGSGGSGGSAGSSPAGRGQGQGQGVLLKHPLFTLRRDGE